MLSDLFEEDGELSVNIKPANISLFQIKLISKSSDLMHLGIQGGTGRIDKEFWKNTRQRMIANIRLDENTRFSPSLLSEKVDVRRYPYLLI